MTEEQLKGEMTLVFARECAAALRDPLDHLLHSGKSREEVNDFVAAAGELYAVAYRRLMETSFSSPRPGCNEAQDQPAYRSSNPAVADESAG